MLITILNALYVRSVRLGSWFEKSTFCTHVDVTITVVISDIKFVGRWNSYIFCYLKFVGWDDNLTIGGGKLCNNNAKPHLSLSQHKLPLMLEWSRHLLPTVQ